MWFDVSCREARQRGAIGIFYPIRERLQAATVASAETAFRAKYETRFGSVEVSPVDGYCEHCGSGPTCSVCGRGVVADVRPYPVGWPAGVETWADLGGES